MLAEIISIGDELLIGQVVNTNATFISKCLDEIGISTRRILTVSDKPDCIERQLADSLSHADLVLTTGGLGPTHDDITKKIIADFFGLGYEFNEEAFERCKALFARRGREMPASNRSQGEVIEGSVVLQNTRGTAPGMILQNLPNYEGKFVVIMPGVPYEMQEMMRVSVVPFFQPHSKHFIKHTSLMTAGIGESTLAEQIGEVKAFLPDGSTLAFLPHSVGVRLRVSSKGENFQAVQKEHAQVVDALKARIGGYLYATTDMPLEEHIGELLKSRGLSIATAESCTGGLIANRLTNIPGSSAYFYQGFVTYSNEAKIKALGVREETLAAHGAVSEETAQEMAAGCLEKTGSDIAISTTGIAGPGGGTEIKPVGMVCIGVATSAKLGSRSFAKTMIFWADRLLNKERFSEAALNLVRELLNAS
ncbi:competence/damage-inducible protein CinA [Chloroherpeton thalassium ATCC 35110]|uniref:CinA-like protein n=1 Tax=Chloroherpeton thalassium (strain ATCC 35110 / GB-78) TaxID=517418 RepID=CINAL_CHLT3|nr:competence/damage-inducible protein A [Chloroherpeton thalassium]B3QTC8.1 RecName: Full=CinA-like protein [Chloroherpeton thalassium ATCC 35110]ACF14227.1 competence/damage-inducible protein CinA [Chloroherpeton thalassium ATCC 35110]